MKNNSQILNIQKNIKSNVAQYKKYQSQTMRNLNANNYLNPTISVIRNYNFAKNNLNSKLNKIYYAVKDNINIKNIKTTGGSLFFKNFISPYSATVIKKLDEAGAIPLCKANLDEFGLGGTGLCSGYGYVKNPFDESRITGGSSSGCAVLVAKNVVPFAIATDTGDSIRIPASFLGIYGFKPTYGLVSRYGVFPYSQSMDHVGVLANNIDDIGIVMDVIAKHDQNDFNSQNVKINFTKGINKIKDKDKMTIVYFSNLLEKLGENETKLFLDTIEQLKKTFNIVPDSTFAMELLMDVPSVYEVISYAEGLSNYRSLNGLAFGEPGEGDDYRQKIKDTRTKNIGNEIKKRFFLSTYCAHQHGYENLIHKFKQIRRMIVDEAQKHLNNYEFIIMLGSCSIAPKIDDILNKSNTKSKPEQNYVEDFLQIANFGGFPSITIPLGKINNMPIGINIMGRLNSDNKLLAVAKKMDQIIQKINFPNNNNQPVKNKKIKGGKRNER